MTDDEENETDYGHLAQLFNSIGADKGDEFDSTGVER